MVSLEKELFTRLNIGSKERILVLIVPVPGHCLPLNFSKHLQIWIYYIIWTEIEDVLVCHISRLIIYVAVGPVCINGISSQRMNYCIFTEVFSFTLLPIDMAKRPCSLRKPWKQQIRYYLPLDKSFCP